MGRCRVFATRWLPPALLDIARSATAERLFDTFGDAQRMCKGSYNDVTLANAVVAKTLVFRKALEESDVLHPESIGVLLGVGSAGLSGNVMSVIDFGGAAGYHYYVARKFIPQSIRLDWRIVETPAMIWATRGLVTNELNFYSSIEAAVSEPLARSATSPVPDLLFSSGALQYVPNPLKTLASLIEVGAGSIVITRMGLSDSEQSYVVVQRSSLRSNGPGPLPDGIRDREVQYPAVFVPRNAVDSLLQSRYDVVARVTDNETAYRAGRKRIRMYSFIGQSRL